MIEELCFGVMDLIQGNSKMNVSRSLLCLLWCAVFHTLLFHINPFQFAWSYQSCQPNPLLRLLRHVWEGGRPLLCFLSHRHASTGSFERGWMERERGERERERERERDEWKRDSLTIMTPGPNLKHHKKCSTNPFPSTFIEPRLFNLKSQLSVDSISTLRMHRECCEFRKIYCGSAWQPVVQELEFISKACSCRDHSINQTHSFFSDKDKNWQLDQTKKKHNAVSPGVEPGSSDCRSDDPNVSSYLCRRRKGMSMVWRVGTVRDKELTCFVRLLG